MSYRSAMPCSSSWDRTTVRQQVAVIADLDDVGSVAQREFKETRNAGIQDAETVLAAFHLKERLVAHVHRHHVADKPSRSKISK